METIKDGEDYVKSKRIDKPIKKKPKPAPKKTQVKVPEPAAKKVAKAAKEVKASKVV